MPTPKGALERRDRSPRRGFSLVRQIRKFSRWVEAGAQNAIEVMRLGQLAPTMNAPFEIVDRDRIHRLRRYPRPESVAHGQGADAPLLLVPPLMLTAEIYDISPDLSCVSRLTNAGVDTWVVDFGAPETEEGGMERTLDDHVRTVAKAVQTVRRITGRDVHLAGYSQGGMFAYQTAAYLRSEGLASVITFGSPVDIHRNLPLLHEGAAAAVIKVLQKAIAFPLERMEGLPGTLSSTAFKLLTPRKELEQLIDMVRMLHDREQLEKRAVRRRFLGGEGFVAWPGPALRTLIDEFVVHNRMMHGGFVIDGQTITLADITVPILCFVGLRDDIARPASVRGIRRAAPLAKVHEITLEAGHFGLVIGSRALRETWPAVVEWLRHGEGRGPLPAPLLPAPAPEPAEEDWEEGSDAWNVDVSLDYELALDTVGAAIGSVGKRLFSFFGDAKETMEALRYQLPPLRRLEKIVPETRVSLSAELARRATETPDATFFLWRGRAFSCKQANERVDNVVRGLHHEGVRRGDRVAVLMEGRPSLLSMISALVRMGAVAVVVPIEAPDAAIIAALADQGVTAITCDPEHAARAQRLAPSTSKKVLVLGGGGETRTLAPGVIDMEAIDPTKVQLPPGHVPDAGLARDLAIVFLLASAGNTASLRPAAITNHRWAFSALGAAAACTLTERDTVYACLPLHHPAGALVSVGSALVGGARLALGSAFSEETFWPEVRRYGATVVFYAGEMARALVQTPATGFDRSHPLRLFAGSGMRPDLASDLKHRFGVSILEFYASTTLNVVFADASGEKPGALGRPLPGSADVALVRYDFATKKPLRDAEGRVVPARIDEPAAALAPTTAHTFAESLTRDRAVENAFKLGDSWWLLPDLLRRDGDGDLHFVDARANVHLAAEGPVFPRLVEGALYRCSDVDRAVVQPVGDRLVASVSTRKPLDPEALTAVLADLAPHARPAVVREVGQLSVSTGFRVLPPSLTPGDLRPGHGVRIFVRDADGTYSDATPTDD